MSEQLLDLIARVQVKFNLTTDTRITAAMQELGQAVARDCVELCEQRVKAFDVAGNEYIVVKNHTQELCVKTIKDYYKIG